MFVDHENRRLPEPWKPLRPKPRLTLGQQKVMVWIVGFNVVMLLFGPLAGTTLLQGLWAFVTTDQALANSAPIEEVVAVLLKAMGLPPYAAQETTILPVNENKPLRRI